MTNQLNEPDSGDFKDAAQRSKTAGVTDESAAFENAGDKSAPPSIDEGEPKSTDDGSGTSETD